jgi:hypothetical protein
MKIGGLCGHCSRDLPLDRRLLFVAELTGQCEMVGCVGNAPTLVRTDTRFTGGSRSLRGYQPMCGIERVDRHGFAPCSSACKADDLLNDRAARENGCGGRIRTGDTRRMKPLPCHLATPLLLENWHGVPVLPRIRKVLETSPRKLTPAV